MLEAGLLDRLTLMTFPVVLGTGKRLFGDGTAARTMTMVDQKVTPRGAVIATYEPGGPVKLGDMGEFNDSQPSQREVARQAAMADGSW